MESTAEGKGSLRRNASGSFVRSPPLAGAPKRRFHCVRSAGSRALRGILAATNRAMSTSMTPDAVASYLQEHPEFFEQYADMLAEIYLPHPHGGRAIPISERQILTLRERSRQLETRLREIIQFGEENDAIGE